MTKSSDKQSRLAQLFRAFAENCGELPDKNDAQLIAALASNSIAWGPNQAQAACAILERYGQIHAGDELDMRHATLTPGSAGDVRVDRIEARDTDFVVTFGRLQPDALAAIQKIPGSRPDHAIRTYVVPATPATLDPLVAFVTRFDIDFAPDFLQHLWATARDQKLRLEASRAAAATMEIPNLGGELRPFQQAGVAYALAARRCFIADQMGLGKTIEALATVQAADMYPALVICPASVKLHWEREATHWLPGRRVQIVDKRAKLVDIDIAIVNYDVLDRYFELLSKHSFRALILDESHFVKNANAKRTKLCTRLASKMPMRLLLTGTPLLNRPEELISQLRILDRLNDIGGQQHFMRRYAGADRTWRERYSGQPRKGEPRHLEELNQKLRETCYVRRTKAEVLAELPAKQRAVVPMPIDNKRDYDRAWQDVVTFIGEAAQNDERRIAAAAQAFRDKTGDEPDAKTMQHIRAEVRTSAEVRARRANQLVKIETLKLVAARGKLGGAKDWIENFLQSGEKLVVFAWHREIAMSIAAQFQAPLITGDTPVKDRQIVVDAFQNDVSVALIVCTVGAGGVGITLTAASNVAFCELGWTPAEHDQAEDRCHRIGQTDSVNVWYLLANGTIDMDIYGLLERKRLVVDATTEGVAGVDSASVLTDVTTIIEKRAYRSRRAGSRKQSE